MSASIDRRLAALELALARRSRTADLARRDVSTMTEAEVIEEWRRLCKAPVPPRPPPLSLEEEAEIIRQWRELTAGRL